MTTELASGQILLGRYRLEYRLGEGGMSEVWAAADTEQKKMLALKVLRSEMGKDHSTRRRMFREARAAAAVVHPNVVRIHEVLEQPDGSPVLLMDLLVGESLREHLNKRHVLSVAGTAQLLLPVISAVGTAHAAGVIHRDLKPENIFLAEEDGALCVKVLDFGIAKLIATGANNSHIQALTNTGTMLGTPYYMAPEQVVDEPVDHRTDVWALGVILYECLTGERPTEADTVGKILRRVLTMDIEPLSKKAPHLPSEVTSLVDRMLSQSLEHRPSSLKEVGEVLEPFAEGVELESFGPPSRAQVPVSSEAEADVATVSVSREDLAQTVVAPTSDEPQVIADLKAENWPDPISIDRGLTAKDVQARLDAHEKSRPVRPPPRSYGDEEGASGRLTRLLFLALGVLALGAGAYFVLGRGKERAPYLPAAASVSVANGACPAGMGLIPGGTFQIGSENGKDDERPVHEMTIASYCLDITEVTTDAYSECIQRGVCRPGEPTVLWEGIKDDVRDKESAHCTLYQTEKSQLPVNCISWSDADAYCKAVGKRLPTEVEWEVAAAGGSEHRAYPWGSAPPGPELVNVCDTSCNDAKTTSSPGEPMFAADDGAKAIARVGHYPKGAARFGMLDMAGNVWEWTASAYCSYPDHECASRKYKVFRGGGWGGRFEANLRPSARMWSDPSHRYSDVGVRCAKSAR